MNTLQKRRVVAQALVKRGDVDRAWQLFAQHATTWRDLLYLQEIARRMQAPELIWQVTHRMVEHPEARPDTVAAVVQSGLGTDDQGTIELVERALRHTPNAPALLRLQALAHEGIDHPQSLDMLSRWGNPDDLSPDAAIEVIDAWIRLGEYTRAQRSLESRSDHPQAQARLAQLALWRNDLDTARGLSEALPDCDLAVRVLAGAQILSGDPKSGLATLVPYLDRHAHDAVAHTWRAEALWRSGEYEQGHDAANTAMTCSRRFTLSARIIRALTLHRPHHSKITRGVREITIHLSAILGPHVPYTMDSLRSALDAMGGNRTPELSFLKDGLLNRFPRPIDPRNQGRVAQNVFRLRGPLAAQQSLDQLLERYPGHPLVHTYRGEMALWTGRFADARSEFEASIASDHATKWAWIGLGAYEMFMGNYPLALEHWVRYKKISGEAGPTMWAYRGEAHRRMGRLDEAWSDLDTALKTSRRRLGTWVNQALVLSARGHDKPAIDIAARLSAHSPGLLGEGTAPEQLEHALKCMRGNRSSSLPTWFDSQGRMRIITWTAPSESLR